MGVQADTLENFGAVSEQCALQMAEGARAQLNADIAVSVTGIAGPGGAVPGKPVGTVWMGVATPSDCTATLFTFEGDREDVRKQTVSSALEGLIAAIEQS